ncbi:Leucine Rich Repeat (LRR)-containing protein [Bernardetia litoralis DSM 6794]|uniref:Leucine Rich Repeat (LRR)-containing protein n=1 Tax=Bernardetia litoralis (strain ATCC 23117 / DSM 6794 / NBRC 15988 / NCIMB 1366 / Fx l1 / Sio-4) TaxID=880071 RepID=I4AQI1_BERLS|nr:immunoglobulin domain-containing protein [Bernardetia litoralis]AFM06216.1 Leucine Rich Repeat (LRR)-containing protein [Bernardetia litoralis DSM 6794]
MNTSTFYRICILIFLILCVHIQSSYSQTTPQQRASVISNGGGTSSSGSFQNFGVIGEPIVSPQIGNGNISGQLGYIYMTNTNEPYYISRNDSLILVDIYNNMGGTNWFNSWDLTTPVRTWVGVEAAYGSVITLNLNQNNLTGTLPNSIRNFSRINESNFEINIGSNRLNFESAEYFINTIPLFTYAPQAKIYSPRDTTIIQGESVIFNSETAGDFNRYQWFKDNIALTGQINPTLEIINATPDDAGEYFCRITNTQATQLILERHKITLNVEGFVNSFDSLALVEIFEETGGTNWTNSWNLNDPVATWEGVTLQGDKIRELDLSRRNLAGNLPNVFDADLFTELRYLSFFDNQLEGQIPATIGELATLTYLDLDKNLFEGAVPTSFGGLTNLQALWLSRNNLDELPNEIGNLASLQNLYLNDNKFTSLPTTIGNLSELLILNVSDNELSEFPNSITNLIKLRELYANRNFIALLPTAMNNLVALTVLEINTNQLSSLPTTVQQLANLSVFRIAENSLEFDDLLPFANRSFQTFDYAPQAPINDEQDILATINQSISFTVQTLGNGNIYQWLKDGQNISTLQTFSINRVQIADAGIYTALVTNPALPNLTLQRRQIILNVECAEGLGFELAQPQQTVFCKNQPFGLRLEISSQFAGSTQINWRKDGVILAFANQITYTVTTAGKYTAEIITAEGCTAISNEIEIITLSQPEVSIELIDNVVFTSHVTSTESITYQWLKDGEAIENAFENTYTPTETGEYSLLILSEAGCSSISQSIIFTQSITGIEEPIELRSLSLFPNPNNGIFFLDFGTNYPNGTPKFTLIDAIGREIEIKIEHISSTRYKIYADKLTGGMYQLKVETLYGTALRKFILSE